VLKGAVRGFGMEIYNCSTSAFLSTEKKKKRKKGIFFFLVGGALI